MFPAHNLDFQAMMEQRGREAHDYPRAARKEIALKELQRQRNAEQRLQPRRRPAQRLVSPVLSIVARLRPRPATRPTGA